MKVLVDYARFTSVVSGCRDGDIVATLAWNTQRHLEVCLDSLPSQ